MRLCVDVSFHFTDVYLHFLLWLLLTCIWPTDFSDSRGLLVRIMQCIVLISLARQFMVWWDNKSRWYLALLGRVSSHSHLSVQVLSSYTHISSNQHEHRHILYLYGEQNQAVTFWGLFIVAAFLCVEYFGLRFFWHLNMKFWIPVITL